MLCRVLQCWCQNLLTNNKYFDWLDASCLSMHSVNCLQGYSPIHPASWRNDLKVIKMCEKAGADMNHITKTGWSTLTCSLKNNNGAMGGDLAHIEPTMEYLLKKGDKIGGYLAHIYIPLASSSLAICMSNKHFRCKYSGYGGGNTTSPCCQVGYSKYTWILFVAGVALWEEFVKIVKQIWRRNI